MAPVLVAAATAAAAAAPRALPFPDFYAVGHRGYPAVYPENTVRSMRESFAAGCLMSEMDLQLSADGEVVILHDSTLQRTTNCSGAASGHALAYMVENCDAGSWKDAEFTGEMVPSLRGMMQAFTSVPEWRNKYLLLDIKGSAQQTRAIIDRIHSMHLPAAELAQLIVSPWTREETEYSVRVLGDSVFHGYISSTALGTDDDGWPASVLNLNKAGIRVAGVDWVVRQRALGRDVMGWTASTEAQNREDTEYAYEHCWNAVVGDYADVLVATTRALAATPRPHTCGARRRNATAT